MYLGLVESCYTAVCLPERTPHLEKESGRVGGSGITTPISHENFRVNELLFQIPPFGSKTLGVNTGISRPRESGSIRPGGNVLISLGYRIAVLCLERIERFDTTSALLISLARDLAFRGWILYVLVSAASVSGEGGNGKVDPVSNVRTRAVDGCGLVIVDFWRNVAVKGSSDI